jgi:hypothetical protein
MSFCSFFSNLAIVYSTDLILRIAGLLLAVISRATNRSWHLFAKKKS